MFHNPWNKAYYKMLQDKDLLITAECGCGTPKTVLPFMTESNDVFDLDFFAEDENGFDFLRNDPQRIIDIASAQIMSVTDMIDIAAMNDLFKSLEQPPYDYIVRYLVVPTIHSGPMRELVSHYGDIMPDGSIHFWTAQILFATVDSNVIAAVGGSFIHGLEIKP